MPPLTRITGQFGYTHKDPERVYKLSRVKDSAIQKPDQNRNDDDELMLNVLRCHLTY